MPYLTHDSDNEGQGTGVETQGQMARHSPERILWRAIGHLMDYRTVCLNDFEARVILRRCICLINDHMTCTCK